MENKILYNVEEDENFYSEKNSKAVLELVNKSFKWLNDCNEVPYNLLPGNEWIPNDLLIGSSMTKSFLAIYMSYVFVISTFFNGIVIVTTIKSKSVRNPLNYIIVNLAGADFFTGIVAGIVVTLASAEGNFFFGKFVCVFEGYVVSISDVAAINSIAIMAFERYLVICKPFGPTKIGNRVAFAGVAFSWIYSAVFNSVFLFLPEGILDAVGTNCAPNWTSINDSLRKFMVVYFISCFLIPLGIIIFCYGGVILNLRKLAKESSLSGSKNPEGEVTKMVILMVTAFLIAWFPYALVSMVIVFNPGVQLTPLIQIFPPFFAKSSLIYNPLIYIGYNRQFRDCVIRMFFAGRNPWSDEIVAGSQVSSQVASQVTTVSTSKVAPA